MVTTGSIIINIIFWHLIGDRAFGQYATLTEKNTRSLVTHVLIYGIALAFGSVTLVLLDGLTIFQAFMWVILNMWLHYIVDYYFGKWMQLLLHRQELGKFLQVLSIDQFIHMTSLFLVFHFVTSLKFESFVFYLQNLY